MKLSKWCYLVGLLLVAEPGASRAAQFGDFEYVINGTAVTVTKYTGAGGAVIIPDSIGGLPVTRIGNYAFVDRTDLTSITIPDSVTNIADSAFSRCTSLTSVRIPDSVTSLGSQAFYRCTGLTSITIPERVTIIGGLAFSGCTGLSSIAIPNSVTSIGVNAFYDCTGLSDLSVDMTRIEATFAGHARLQRVVIGPSVTGIEQGAFSGCTGLVSIGVAPLSTTYSGLDGVLYDKRQTTLLRWPEGKTGAFVVPDSVTGIGVGAFAGCTGLTSIVIPNSVTSIGGSAFSGCTGLSDFSINMIRIDPALAGSASLKRLVIGPSVSSIGNGAFSGCTGLTSLVIGNSVTNIGSGAFTGCTGLTNVIIPDSVTTIGQPGCDVGVYVCGLVGGCTWVGGDCGMGLGAFGGCTGLTNVVIGNAVTSIGVYTFSGCTGLASVTIGKSVTSIGPRAFESCANLTTMTIPDSVTRIEVSAFTGCTGLTNVTIPDSVTTIGQPGCSAFVVACGMGECWCAPGGDCGTGLGAFGGCTGLTNVVIGNAVTSIGAYTFSGCTRLARVTIGNSVSTIGARAFESCTNLTTITIPDSVTSLGGVVHGCGRYPDALVGPFGGCTGLTSVYFEGEAVWTDTFNAAPATIYYLPGSVGWGPTYFGRPTAPWLPRIETCGVQEGQFVCTVRWGRHRTVALDVCADLAKPSWSSVGTNTLSNSTASFTDPESAARPASFYRVREITPPRAEITVTGEVGEMYVVESATDAGSDFWLTRGWIELTTPTAIWTDPMPTPWPGKAYRPVKVVKPVVQTIPNMVWIPPGRFVMGSSEGERGRNEDEGPQTRVTLTKGFWMGKYEVTQREYLAVMGSNPSYFQPPEFPGDLDRPVEQVCSGDAVAYCQKLTDQERAAGRIGTNAVYRLPTEAEWEYACRAGTTRRFSFGDALGCGDECDYCPLLDSYMWWCGNSGGQSHPVGSKLPNPWGLYDLHGSVREWCRDLFDWDHPEYPGGAVVDPQGPSTGSGRVIRGGGGWGGWHDWSGRARNCRSAYRNDNDAPDGRDSDLGFRAVLAPGQ